jgi:hypothetical protein
MRRVVVKPPGFPQVFFCLERHLRRCPGAGASMFNCQRPTTARQTDPTRELAASISQEPFGSHAPSIRVGAMHRAPETAFGEAWERVPLLAHGSTWEPGVFDGDAHQLGIARPARDVFLRYTADAFSCAPSGTVPVSTYRQSAMRSFRARATMPMRRIRFPPPPNRSRYQRLSALVG